MLSLFGKLKRCESGTVAIIFLFALIPIIIIAGASVDYSRRTSAQQDLQPLLDSAVLAGATLPTVKPEDGSIYLPQERVDHAYAHIKGALEDHRFDEVRPLLQPLRDKIKIVSTNGGTGLQGTLDVTVPTNIIGFFGSKTTDISLFSSTGFSQDNSQLDMVFCIDATGSMQPTIADVTKNAGDLAVNINAELQGRGYGAFGAIRARVIFFRDFGVDKLPVRTTFLDPDDPSLDITGKVETGPDDPPPILYMPKSPLRSSRNGNFWVLPQETADLQNFLKSETAAGGGDEPEDGFVCLNEAIESRDWAKAGDTLAGRDRNDPNSPKISEVSQMIVIWTDANAVPPDDALSRTNRDYPSSMPRTVAEIEAKWEDTRFIENQEKKVLVFFGNTGNSTPMRDSGKDGSGNEIKRSTVSEARWEPIKSWRKFFPGGALVEARNDDLIKKLVDALATQHSAPRLTR